MKLIITGASGFVATELIRQSLSNPEITSIIALARRPVSAPSNLSPGADASKLHSVVLNNYDAYPDDVKTQLKGADACIWTVAITPNKARGMDFAQIRRVCHDQTLIGLEEMLLASSQERTNSSNPQPFRFLYMSGAKGERDQSKTPGLETKYLLMRGETENQILALATGKYRDQMTACVAKPGIITQSGQYLKTALAVVLWYVIGLPRVDVKECAAAMLHEVVQGFSKEPLLNEDLVRIGRRELGSGR
ncbi:MAG: hypothetical protein Q9222_005220 [Ikaeria aurantiellina]